MRCEEYQALVEEYFDGELDERTTRTVLVHVDNCASCSTALEQLTLEHRAYQGYERELEVSPALWNKVREQLAEENNRQTLTLLSRSQIEFGKLLSLQLNVAASIAIVLFAVVVTVAVMKYLNKPKPPERIALSSQTPTAEKLPPEIDVAHEPAKISGAEGRSEASEVRKSMASRIRVESARRRSLPESGEAPTTAERLTRPVLQRDLKTPEQLVRAAEKQYLSAIALLTRDARERPSQLDSETRVKLDGALAAIDRTILSTRKAVKRNPNDALAVQYMLSAYAKKVDVLKEMGSY